MNLFELICSALLSLRAHKIRVFLTMIGIIIGISSVVIILSIGAGLKSEVNQSTSDVGVNTITINYKSDDLNSISIEKPFEYTDFKDLQDINGVDTVAESTGGLGSSLGITESAEIFDKKTSLALNPYKNEAFSLLAGRLITKEDNDFQNYVVIITEKHAEALFGKNVEDGVGKGIKIKGEFFQVVGIENSDSGNISATNDYIPEFAHNLFENDKVISSIDVKIKDGFSSNSVFENIRKELKILHPNLKEDYVQADPQELSKALGKIIGGLTLFIAIVSGISLFVGGIGVMNIMYVSVTERRREIGIRRAIGATPSNILLQFLIESIFITSIGGILGIGIGYGISMIIGLFLPFKPILTLGILFGSSITSIIIGITFGIIPASRAANLNPIKAIYK